MMSNAMSRGERWLETLAPNAKRIEGLCPSVQAADGELNGETVRFIAVVPDANNHFRARRKGKSACLKAGRWRKWSAKPSRQMLIKPLNARLWR